MEEPEKPFSCPESGCGATFTNEDRLAVHSKKHDMVLQLGPKGGNFVADQTPTPTRFIRNCEEVGLFQDLQNVNPFDETFKRAMETRPVINLSLENHLPTTIPDDTLHTPHIFPHLPEDPTSNIYVIQADHRNINKISNERNPQQLTENDALACVNEQEKNSFNINNKGSLEDVPKVHEKLNPRIKLTRQDSIDLTECDNPSMMYKRQLPLSSINDAISHRKEIKIPGITISDSSKRNIQISNSEVDFKDCNNFLDSKTICSKDSQTRLKNNVFLNVPEMGNIATKRILKNNSLKLISQKSIDMALDNFTNEASERTMDLNNVSIEDIPNIAEENNDSSVKILIDPAKQDELMNSPMTSIINHPKSTDIHDCNVTYAVGEKDCLSHNDNINKPTDLLEGKLPDIKKTVLGEIHQSPVNVCIGADVNNCQPNAMLEDTNKTSSPFNNDNQGYELLLKWPDGRKVYLKEVFRENDILNDHENVINNNSDISTPSTISHSNDIPTFNVKRKLKETIVNNAKKTFNSHAMDNFTNAKLPIKPLNTTSNPLAKDCIILPQSLILHKPSDLPILLNESSIVNINQNKVDMHSMPFLSNLLQQNQEHIFLPPTSNLPNSQIIDLGMINQTENCNEKIKVSSILIEEPRKSIVPKLLPKPFFIKPTNNLIKIDNSMSDYSRKVLPNISSIDNSKQAKEIIFTNNKNVNNPILKKNPSKKAIVKNLNNSVNNTKNSTSAAKNDNQEHNRAAVTRYRKKKKAFMESMEQENKTLKEKLNQATLEIQKLNATIGNLLVLHNNCSVTKKQKTIP